MGPGGGLQNSLGLQSVEAVTGDDQAVPGQQLVARSGAIYFRDLLTGHGAHEHIARKARFGLHIDALGSHTVEVTAVTVIFVLLAEIAIADQVDMAIADADPINFALGNGRGHHGATHAVQAGRFLDGFLQPVIGILQGHAQHPRRVLLTELTGEGLIKSGHHQIAGDVAGCVTTHAIGDDDQRRGLWFPGIVVEIGSQESVFLIIPGACDLVAGDF